MATHFLDALLDEPVSVPAGIVDLKTFRDWAHSDAFPERGRISWLAGEILIDMSLLEIETHIKVCRDVGGKLWHVAHERSLGELLPRGPLYVSERADIATQPDLMFSSWETLRSGRVEYREHVRGSNRFVEVVGTPDLVVEVVSRSSVRKDTRVLRRKYFEAGIPEYWLIDARKDEIDFQLLVRGAREYEAAEADAEGFRPSAVLSHRVRLTRGVNPVGGAKYRLELA